MNPSPVLKVHQDHHGVRCTLDSGSRSFFSANTVELSISHGTLTIDDREIPLHWIEGVTRDMRFRNLRVELVGIAPVTLHLGGHPAEDVAWLEETLNQAIAAHEPEDEVPVPEALAQMLTDD